jgi:hypothetical protein
LRSKFTPNWSKVVDDRLRQFSMNSIASFPASHHSGCAVIEFIGHRFEAIGDTDSYILAKQKGTMNGACTP